MAPNPQITSESFVAAVQDQLTCELGGESAILHLPDGIYYGLNETGAFLWERLQSPVQVSALREAMLQEFDVSPEEAERDLFGLLNELREANLLETRDAPVS